MIERSPLVDDASFSIDPGSVELAVLSLHELEVPLFQYYTSYFFAIVGDILGFLLLSFGQRT